MLLFRLHWWQTAVRNCPPPPPASLVSPASSFFARSSDLPIPLIVFSLLQFSIVLYPRPPSPLSLMSLPLIHCSSSVCLFLVHPSVLRFPTSCITSLHLQVFAPFVSSSLLFRSLLMQVACTLVTVGERCLRTCVQGITASSVSSQARSCTNSGKRK